MNTNKPKGLKALRCKLRLDGSWESPPLHILVTAEDGLIVARCLDFTVATHGDTVEEAVNDLTDMLADHVRYYLERGIPDKLIRPDHEEHWQIFNALEIRSERRALNKLKAQSLAPPTKGRRAQRGELVYA